MVFIDGLLWRNAFFSGPYSYRHTVFVGAADKKYRLFFQPFKTCVNVGRQIYTRQMTYMNGAIGIRQSGCNSSAIVIFHRKAGLTMGRHKVKKFAKISSLSLSPAHFHCQVSINALYI